MKRGKRNWPAEMKAFKSTVTVLALSGYDSINAGYVPASRKELAIPAKIPKTQATAVVGLTKCRGKGNVGNHAQKERRVYDRIVG